MFLLMNCHYERPGLARGICFSRDGHKSRSLAALVMTSRRVQSAGTSSFEHVIEGVVLNSSLRSSPQDDRMG